MTDAARLLSLGMLSFVMALIQPRAIGTTLPYFLMSHRFISSKSSWIRVISV